MKMEITEETIEDYLSATEKPFSNRLEVVCYLWLNVNYPGSQEKQQADAIDLAASIGDHVFVDVDRR